jgi:hypothetical protein
MDAEVFKVSSPPGADAQHLRSTVIANILERCALFDPLGSCCDWWDNLLAPLATNHSFR